MLKLYSAQACPFAQRTRALLTHLGVGFHNEEIDLDNRDSEFLKLTPTGKVPLLVDGKKKLYESMVINSYIADANGFTDAYAGDPYVRARELLGMLQWDKTVAPAFYGAMRDPDKLNADIRKKLGAELDELVQTVYAIDQRVGNMLSFHCAPFWARMDWLREFSPVAELIDERIQLRKWLDSTVAQEPVQQTLPDKQEMIDRYRKRFAAS